MNCPICKTCNIADPQNHINKCAATLRAALDEAKDMAYQAFWNRNETYRILDAWMKANPKEAL